MGAWGTGPFDNDNAANFSGDLEDCSDDQARNDLLTTTLAQTVDHDFTDRPMIEGYEFPYEIEHAIAAAAYVADARSGHYEFTDNVFAMRGDKEGDYHPLTFAPVSQELVWAAQKALRRILEQMEYDGIDPEWCEATRQILASLSRT